MIYRITGADSKTGADRSVRVHADNEQHALSVAKSHGIYAYKVERDKAAERAEVERIKAEEEADRFRMQQLELQERSRQEAERRAAEERRRVVAAKKMIHSRLDAGYTVFLYETRYVPVDSIVLEKNLHSGFDIPELRLMGIAGWEIMQVVPRTMGVGLHNTSIGSTMGTSWGGGSGGNVMGVHVILKKAIRKDDLNDSTHEEIENYVRANLNSFGGV